MHCKTATNSRLFSTEHPPQPNTGQNQSVFKHNSPTTAVNVISHKNAHDRTLAKKIDFFS
jgi:hypothetical protein